ncbi:hypothetical protein [Sphingobacterium anhuiense]|uniref:hypothetical protein n=1 Tax=Sphingobacterium anhuiense TaxID=493780 RepID=UPI003C2C37CC
MPWFQLLPNGDLTDPNDYNLVGAPNCSGLKYICAIQASADVNSKPVLTTALRNEMLRALQTKSNSTNVLLRSNP